MREIKFKLWNPPGKNMIEDVENVYDCLKQQHVHDKTQPSRGFTLPYDHISEGLVWLQYTGLKDKNGKEIYEGDILKFILDNDVIEYGVVRFSKNGFWTSQDESKQEQLLSDELSSNLVYHIVGNVHHNPELIQVKG